MCDNISDIQQIQPPEPPKKQPYKGFSFKERLLPSILLAILAPLTVACIAPFEIFGGNLDEFKFVLGDFFGLCLLAALAASAVLAAVLLVCRGRVFDVVFGLIFGLSIMTFVQSTFLSLTQTALDGDGTGSAVSMGQIVLNTVIWAVIAAACIVAMLLLNRHKDTVRLISVMVLGIALFMSFVSFLTVSLTTDVYATAKQPAAEVEQTGAETGADGESDDTAKRMLTVENLTTLAKDRNVIVFVVDRFSNEYYHTAQEACPEIFAELGGFTFFDDYISLYPRTLPAVPHLVTGVEDDFSLSRVDYLQKAYQEAPLMNALYADGYDINVYTDDYYGYDNASDMAAYTSNISGKMEYTIVNKPRLSWDMLRLGLYRSLPLAAQPLVGTISTPTFEQYVVYKTEQDIYSTNMKKIYETLTADDFTLRETDNGYSFIHMSGCHLPTPYNEDFEVASAAERNDSTVAMKVSFKLISRYIQEMKRLGVYEDATILILGDHCSIGSDTESPYFAHLTSLMVKPAGRSTGDIRISHAPITSEDIFATILDAADVSTSDDDRRTVFEIGEDEVRTRRYLFQRLLSNGKYEEEIYEITGPGKDLANWKLVGVRSLGKSIYS